MTANCSRQAERRFSPSPARVVARLVALASVLAVGPLAAACSDDGGQGTATGSVDEVVASTVVVDDTNQAGSGGSDGTGATDQDDGDGADSSTTADGDGGGGTTAPAGSAGLVLSDDELPGDEFSGFAGEGDQLTVVGVAHDDVLNVRQGPGTDFPVVAELDPVGDPVPTTGRARLLTRSLWYEIEVGTVTGWVNAGFLAYPGTVDDVTAAVTDSMGEVASAETMLGLGRTVANDRASDDVRSRITMAVAPEVGDLGEVTYDVIGLADDAVLGYRLHVFGAPAPSGEGFRLKTVEQTVLCGRGVDDEGRCL